MKPTPAKPGIIVDAETVGIGRLLCRSSFVPPQSTRTSGGRSLIQIKRLPMGGGKYPAARKSE
jgi:hypothetical protein